MSAVQLVNLCDLRYLQSASHPPAMTGVRGSVAEAPSYEAVYLYVFSMPDKKAGEGSSFHTVGCG